MRTCARRHAPRLGMRDHALHAAADAQTDFRQLRGLAGTGLAAHDSRLKPGNGLRQFFASGHHRQVGGIFNRGQLLDARCPKATGRAR